MCVSSPFRLSSEYVAVLLASPSFGEMQQCLAAGPGYESFCSAHVATLEAQDMAEFKLHRDILHAACQPVVRVFKAASRVASIIRPTRPTADLELAFSGDARDFYVWLQSVLADEDGFCATNGCPACIVLRVFYSEPLIRFIAVACRISEYMRLAGIIRKGEEEMPSFVFLLNALQTAVEKDDLWGPACWTQIDEKAESLESSSQQLIRQTRGLELALSVNGDSTHPVGINNPIMRRSLSTHPRVIPLCPSTLAKKQLAMKQEELLRLSCLLEQQESLNCPGWNGIMNRKRSTRTRVPSIFGPNAAKARGLI